MLFKETTLKDSYVIEPQIHKDQRGLFFRTFCEKEFESKNLSSHFPQCSISVNPLKGTIRGMHYQVTPYEEAKLVRCIKGSIYDVILDLRTDSPSYMKFFSIELSEYNNYALYIPKGFAHGFQTLEDNSILYYHISEFYNDNASKGIRYNDPIFNITWPLEISIISERDKNYEDFLR